MGQHPYMTILMWGICSSTKGFFVQSSMFRQRQTIHPACIPRLPSGKHTKRKIHTFTRGYPRFDSKNYGNSPLFIEKSTNSTGFMDEFSTSMNSSPSHTSQAPDVLSYLEPSMMAWKDLKEDRHVTIGIPWSMMSLPQCSACLYI